RGNPPRRPPMQAMTSPPETEGSPTDGTVAVDSSTCSLSQADLGLMVAVVAALAIIGLLVLIGIGGGVAVCITFVLAFAVTTTPDVKLFLRVRRIGSDRSRFLA